MRAWGRVCRALRDGPKRPPRQDRALAWATLALFLAGLGVWIGWTLMLRGR